MTIINIGIYLGPKDGKEIDATNIEKGNPGIGGKQFCMLQLAYALSNLGKYKVFLFAKRNYKVNQNLKFIKIQTESDVIKLSIKNNLDILIADQFRDEDFRKTIRSAKLKIIAWCHNYIHSDTISFIEKTPQIVSCVFVSKQMYDRYIDNNIIKKSTFIYNMIYDNFPNEVREIKNHTVVYMGSIVEGKGFRELCSIWKGINNEIPDSKLIVIGNGMLYGDAVLGKLGIAEEKYEKTFRKFLTNENGEIIPSVIFKGIIGEEKLEIFKEAAVGVINPTGRTETFGMGIVEMAQTKLPVVTIAKNGFFDTIINGETGILAKNINSIQKEIIKLLNDKERNLRLGENAKKYIQKFSPDIIVPMWDQLLTEVANNRLEVKYLKPSKPYTNNYKWLRMILRFLRFKLNLKFIPTLLNIEDFVVKIIR